MKPVTQGDLDGTCGIYSIVNSIDLLFPKITEQERARIFKYICLSISDKWPAVLWAGTTETDMRKMLKAATDALKGRHVCKWDQPFRRYLFSNFEEFKRELRWRIQGDSAFAVVGISKPWEHWTTVHDLTEKLMHMTDSCKVKQIPLAKCGLAGDGTEFEFDYKQTFVLMKGTTK